MHWGVAWWGAGVVVVMVMLVYSAVSSGLLTYCKAEVDSRSVGTGSHGHLAKSRDIKSVGRMLDRA